MVGDAVSERPGRGLLTLGRVDRVRVQVGYRAAPEVTADQQFLLDVPVPEPHGDGAAVDEQRVLVALEPVLYAGAGAPRHYSLHQHRWHTSWGPSPGALELGLLVTTGTLGSAIGDGVLDGVAQAFADVLDLVGRPEAQPLTRDAAILRARQGAATAYSLDPQALMPSTEQHHPATGAWTVRLRAATADEYDVVVGLVDGYPGSVRVRHRRRAEVWDSLGSE